jgi:tetratricopeptide (TPR) repeat protein
MTRRRILTKAFTLLALAGGAQAQEEPPVPIDLAVTTPERVHILTVPARPMLRVEIRNVLPSARYEVTYGVEGGWSGTGTIEPHPLDRTVNPRWETPECTGVFASLRRLWALASESAMPEERGRLEAETEKGTCGDARMIRGAVGSILVHSEGGSFDPEASQVLTIERLTAPQVTWRFRLQADRKPPMTWSRSDETSWLAAEVVTALDQMASARGAKSRPAKVETESHSPNAATLKVRLTHEHGHLLEWNLDLAASVFSPAAYLPLARQLLGRPPSSPAAGEDPAPFLQRLTDARVSVLQAENQRVSAQLSRRLDDPEAHERAALLLAALALKEHAGPFADPRRTLCRLVAHLALASALRQGQPPGPAGAWADAARLALIGRQREALERIDRLEKASPGARAWANALRVRVTGDWRAIAKPLEATLLERLEIVRALGSKVGGTNALEFLRRRNIEDVGDWARIGLNWGSVETGNAFVRQAQVRALVDLTDTYRAYFGRPLPSSDIEGVLNASPSGPIATSGTGTVQVEVIDWGTWARFYQRHLVHAIVQADEHERSMLGRPEEADTAWRGALSRYGRLTLFPLAVAQVAAGRGAPTSRGSPRQEGDDGCRESASLWEERPEELTAANWDTLVHHCKAAFEAGTLPGGKRWFGEGPPWGTVFDLAARARLSHGSAALSYQDLRALAPYDDVVLWRVFAERFGKIGRTILPGFAPLSLEAIDELFGPLVDYDVRVMKERSHLLEDDPEAFARYYERIAAIDGNAWVELATYLCGRGRDVEAAAAFQKAIDDSPNRVLLGANLYWLVDYLEDHGESEKAFAAAREAADTYSNVGLATMARLMERRRQWEEAEAWYKKQAERYQDDRDLNGFYLRYDLAHHDGRYQEQAAHARSALFPDGLRKLDPLDLKGRPTEGVRVKRAAPRFEPLGIRVGTMVVSIHGYRVRNLVQYRALREMNGTSMAVATIWSGNEYREVSAPLGRPHVNLVFEDLESQSDTILDE